MRIGSRTNPLTSALLAGYAQGAFTLPPEMIEARDRLAAVQAAVLALRPPNGEVQARDEAVRALMADPTLDVGGAVHAGREVDAAHELRAGLLQEATEHAYDALDRIDPDEVLTGHLQPAYAAVLDRLAAAYRGFSLVSTNPDDLWDAPTKVRNSWSEFRRAAGDHETLREAWRAVRAGSPCQLDTEGLFDEIKNLDAVWAERTSGQRPISQMTPPWPPRRDVIEYLLWTQRAGAVLHLPTSSEQDAAWSVAFGARAAAFAGGDQHVAQMRELGRDVMAH